MYNCYLVGKNIRRFRLDKKYTIQKMAELLNVSESHLTQVELGIRNMSIKLLYETAVLLGTDANSLLGLDATEYPIEDALSDFPLEKAKELKSVFMELIELAKIVN